MLPIALSWAEGIKGEWLEAPPPAGFDCARDAQNRFLYEHAWTDQEELLSMTYLYRVRQAVAAYATVRMTDLVLGTREKPRSVRYKHIGALHLAQLGVDRRFQREGLGRQVVGDVIGLGCELSEHVGCRYLSLDAQPDLVNWYEEQGFTINKVMQKQRIEQEGGKRMPGPLPVSMRFDLMEL